MLPGIVMAESFTILMVDDDKDDQDLFREALETINGSVNLMTADDGLDALQLLNSSPAKLPGLIILDINMPRMNGIEFLRHIRKPGKFSDIPVVIFSTASVQQFKDESKALGATGFIVKPDNFTRLCFEIRELLNCLTFEQKKN